MERTSNVLLAGCGYVGSELARLLLSEGRTVHALSRNPERIPGIERLRSLPGHFDAIRGDVTDPASLRGLPAAVGAVIYTVSADRGDEEAYRAAYSSGPANLLDALDGSDGIPGRFLFASSTAVYGIADGSWVDDDSPAEPTGFRGRTLLEGESVVRERAVEGVAVRFAGIYGPGRTRLVELVRSGEARCSPHPDWTNRIHRDDCAGFLRHLLDLDQVEEVYLGVDDEPADRCALYRWIADAIGVPAPPTLDRSEGSRGNKRCRNRRLAASGYRLRFPTFREGYAPLL